MNGHKFRGVVTAMVTPFKDGQVDEASLRRHVREQIAGGVQGLVPCGTTGESPTMTHAEHNRVVAVTVEEAAGRCFVLAGAGSNCTREAIDLAEHAQKDGADGLLCVAPYYNKPTQEGLARHYKAIAASVDLPLVIYNIPSRCGVNILPETLAELSQVPNIVGVKEATGNLTQMIRTIELCGPDFLVTSGDDGLTLPLLAAGGDGVISVASNVAPRAMAEMWALWEAGDVAGCRARFYKLLPLFRALFAETNPMPVKAALGLMGRMSPEMRLPLCQPKPATIELLKPLLKGLQ